MRRAFIASLLVHVAIILAMTLGYLLFPHQPLDIAPPIPITVVSNIGKNAAPEKGESKPPPKKSEIVEKKLEKPKPPTAQKIAEKPEELPIKKPVQPPKPVEVPEPREAKKPEPKLEKPKKLEEKPAIKPEKPIEKPVKKAEAVPEKKPVKPKEKPPQKNPTEEQSNQQFASILKNLAKPEETPTEKTESESTQPADSKPAAPDIAAQLTADEMAALVRQIESCWNVPAGAKSAENLVVELYVEVNPDRTVQKVEIVDIARMQADGFYRSAAESARRALLNPQCRPLMLPPDRYNEWKTMRLRFDPREMFGL
ncbi:MAG: energy transducer TonB [Alphaproteobacteria bacterium]